jgi:hypothetical protein
VQQCDASVRGDNAENAFEIVRRKSYVSIKDPITILGKSGFVEDRCIPTRAAAWSPESESKILLPRTLVQVLSEKVV